MVVTEKVVVDVVAFEAAVDSGDGHPGLPKRSQDEKLEELTELIRKAIDGTEATLNAVKKKRCPIG